MNRRVQLCAHLPLLLLLLLPVGLQAQACMGISQGARAAIGGATHFHDGATSWGLSGMTGAGSALYLSGTIGITTHDIDGVENETNLSVGASYELPALRASASVCPTVAVGYSFIENLNVLTVPLGIGVGSTFPLGDAGDATLTPWLTPQLLWVRASLDGVDESDSDTFFGVNGGATVGFGQFMVGGSVSKIFEEGTDTTLGVHAGFIL